jgi:3-oxoacyl-(acyl-carrier-protein) synthase
VAAVTASGRTAAQVLAGAVRGEPAFGPVRRFDVTGRRVKIAATLPGSPVLMDELADAVDRACEAAGLTAHERAGCPLLLAVHGDPDAPRAPEPERQARGAGGLAEDLATRCGLKAARASGGAMSTARAYTSACVAATTAVADAGAMLALSAARAPGGAMGGAERVVVAAGYLVDPDQFALFDAGRALATDGEVRPFSTGRTGLLLGDGIAAMVLETGVAARRRGAPVLARLAGWGRAGDAYHVCQPRPDGAGLARAIDAALRRAGVAGDDIGYVNAHGSGTVFSDAAEAAALHRALGPVAGRVPVSSTKSVHGQSLEASGLVELVITVLALRDGLLPVNAGFLAPDADCPLDVIVGTPREVRPRYALSLNAAFGGANTALLVGAL